MKKTFIFCGVLILTLFTSLTGLKAEELKTFYVNSEQTKEESFDIAHMSEGQLVDDGRFEAGKVGEYTLKFQGEGGADLEKVILKIVQSEGTVVDVTPLSGNVIEMSELECNSIIQEEGNIEEYYSKLSNVINKRGGALVSVKLLDGSTKTFTSNLVIGADGGGGFIDDAEKTLVYSYGYIPVNAQRGIQQINEASSVKYYNPIDSKEDGEGMFGTAVERYTYYYISEKKDNVYTSEDNTIKVNDNVVLAEGASKIKVKSKEIKLDENLIKDLKTKKFKSMNITLTDDLNNEYNLENKVNVEVKLSGDLNSDNIIVYQLENEKLLALDSEVSDDIVSFKANIPGNYIIAESIVNEEPEGSDVVIPPKQDQKVNGNVKTSDNTIIIAFGILAISSLGIIKAIKNKYDIK